MYKQTNLMSHGLMKKKSAYFNLIVFRLTLAFAVLFFTLYPVEAYCGEKLNLLLITIDTLRADRLSCYSTEHVETPNIDSLASKSTLFTRAFAHTPTTLPSHTNILLGTTPLYHGVHDNLSFKVKNEFLTLAEHLKQEGYSTGAFVGAFILDSIFGLSQGFDTYDGNFGQTVAGKRSAERPAEIVVDKALEFLNQSHSPWFLWIHCYDPHDPYEPPEPFKTKHNYDLYDGEVAYVDSVLNKLFQYLENKDYYKNTVIVFTGDHGESLGEHGENTHGYFAYNSTLWIPLIIYVPGIKPQIVDQNVSHIDLFPTICDTLNIKKPLFLQGISLIPSMKGKKLRQQTIYFESLQPYYNLGWAPIRGIIQDKYKFTDSPIPELYDLENDFHETKDISPKNDLDIYRKQLSEILKTLKSSEQVTRNQRIDRDALEKLKSLGYIGDNLGEKKKDFGPGDDVKVLLPYINKSDEALWTWQKGNSKDGIRILQEVLSEKPSISTAYIYLALIYKSEGRLNDSIQVLQAGFESNPESYLIFSAYLDHLFEAKRWTEIIQAFEKMDYPQFEFDPVNWNLAGLAYSYIGNIEKAILLCEKAVSIDHNYPLSYNNLGNIHFNVFNLSKNPEALQKALVNYQKAVELDPQLSQAHLGIGLIFMYENNFIEAAHHLETAYQLQPDFDAILYNLGITYLKMGNKTKALSFFNKFKGSQAYKQMTRIEKENLKIYILQCKEEIYNKR